MSPGNRGSDPNHGRPLMHKHLDRGTLVTLAVTLVLFVVALFTHGFSHDILLEAAVFLVSVKLVIMSYKASASISALDAHLATLAASLARVETALLRDPGSNRQMPG